MLLHSFCKEITELQCEEFTGKIRIALANPHTEFAGVKIKFIIDIADLEPSNLASESSSTEEDVIIRVF